MANVVKHAQASNCHVALVSDRHYVHVTVKDDGRGFGSGHLPKSGIGLIGMRERASALPALISIQSSVDQGTTIEVNLRLSENV